MTLHQLEIELKLVQEQIESEAITIRSLLYEFDFDQLDLLDEHNLDQLKALRDATRAARHALQNLAIKNELQST